MKNSKFNEIKKLLKNEGNKWRAEHTTIIKSGANIGNTKVDYPKFYEVGDVLKKHVTFCTIGEDEKELDGSPLYHYDPDEGIYTTATKVIDDLITTFDKRINKQGRGEIREYLRIKSPERKLTNSTNLIIVGNGIVKLDTMELLPFSKKYVFTNKIITDYNSNANEPSFNGWKFSEWLKDLSNGDEKKHLLLWQMIASVIRGQTGLMYLFVDNGQGRTGKGTLQLLLEQLVGKNNCRSLTFEQFDDKHVLAHGYGARLIIGDDNNPKAFIKGGSNLKSIVTNESVLIDPKFEKPFTGRFNAVVIQSINGLPNFSDTSGGLYRRFRMIYFDHQFPEDRESKLIKDKYIKNPVLLRWILKKALTIDIGEIANPSESKELVEETRIANDPVAYFLQAYLPKLKSEKIPSSFLFQLYLAVMRRENNPQRISQRKFTKDIRPKMEALGWEYKNNGSRAGSSFDKADIDLFEDYRPHYGVGSEIKFYLKDIRDSKEGLFIKK